MVPVQVHRQLLRARAEGRLVAELLEPLALRAGERSSAADWPASSAARRSTTMTAPAGANDIVGSGTPAQVHLGLGRCERLSFGRLQHPGRRPTQAAPCRRC
jgi:hypothetical protein